RRLRAQRREPGLRSTRLTSMRATAMAVCLFSTAACALPFSADSGANQILIPARRPATVTDVPHAEVDFRTFDGLTLRGWLFRSQAARRRGLIVYLHGIGDDRRAAAGMAQRFGPEGYDVLGYDSRAHGQSDGRYCTYGYFE